MFCQNCAKEISDKAVACPGCGVPPLIERKFCRNCGSATDPKQVLCTKCGVSLGVSGGVAGEKSKVAAGLLGLFLGALGIHKFYLGYSKSAVIMLVVAIAGGLVTFSIATWVMALIGFIEGIIYLTKSDGDFDTTYVRGKKEWF
jgi:TM2 domain-containing membrane protein YozV